MYGFSFPNRPNQADYTIFLRGLGIRTTFLPDNSIWIGITYNVAIALVNDTLAMVAPSIYTLAVYNLAADRLMNFAPDQDSQTFFQDKRREYGVYSFVPGIVTGAGDQGTSGSLLSVESMKNFTLQDLQTLKTPMGRWYMGHAQAYGPDVWGLS